jgi:hypothetical protein
MRHRRAAPARGQFLLLVLLAFLMDRFGPAFAFQLGDLVFELKFAPLQFGQFDFIGPGARPFLGNITVESCVTAFEFGEMAFQRHAVLLLKTHPQEV